MLNRTDELHHVWQEPPEPGTAREVAPGVHWVCLPLPFRLNHVNVWLIEEEDGWTVIDTGCRTDEILGIWETLLAGTMRGKPIVRVIATHGHVDHIGLSGWLVERFGSRYVGTFGEWLWSRISHATDMDGASATHLAYLRRHGFEDALAGKMASGRRRFIDLATPIPGAIEEIRDGDTITLGGRPWRVIVTRGHAFEHAGFYDESSGVLIAGDHLLPRISPVIAVYEMLPHDDPLGDYLASFTQFDAVADDALVLPSHGLPYRGIRTRIAQLRKHHDARLAETVDLLDTPMNGVTLARRLFPHVEGASDIGFALGETLAHVNHLVRQGRVTDVSGQGEGPVYRARQGLNIRERQTT